MKQNKPSNSRIADKLSMGEDCPGLFQWSVLCPGPDRSQELNSPQKGCFFTVSVCGDRDSSSQSPSSALRESLLSSRRRLGGDLERGVCGERDRGKVDTGPAQSFQKCLKPVASYSPAPLCPAHTEMKEVKGHSGGGGCQWYLQHTFVATFELEGIKIGCREAWQKVAQRSRETQRQWPICG